jgi:chromosome partitioning protein
MRKLPVYNRKGGVGKTATTVNTGHGLVRRGKRVLVIDWDPQKNLTTHIGIQGRPKDAITAAEAFLAPSKTLEAIGPSVVEGLDLLYGSTDLAEAEKQILVANHSAPGLIMTRMLKRIEAIEKYDYVLIDCPGSDGQLARNALIAAPEVLVPIQTEYAAMEGLGLLRRLLRNLVEDETIEEPPKVIVVATLVNEQTRTGKTLKGEVGALPGVIALKTVIHRNAPVADCYGFKQTVFDYDPRSRGAAEYAALAEELDNG